MVSPPSTCFCIDTFGKVILLHLLSCPPAQCSSCATWATVTFPSHCLLTDLPDSALLLQQCSQTLQLSFLKILSRVLKSLKALPAQGMAPDNFTDRISSHFLNDSMALLTVISFSSSHNCTVSSVLPLTNLFKMTTTGHPFPSLLVAWPTPYTCYLRIVFTVSPSPLIEATRGQVVCCGGHSCVFTFVSGTFNKYLSIIIAPASPGLQSFPPWSPRGSF